MRSALTFRHSPTLEKAPIAECAVPPTGAAAGANVALHGERHALGQLADREVGAEVVRYRVEPATVHDPGPRFLGGGVVADVHEVDEFGLAGKVEVVGAAARASLDERLSVLDVGPDGCDHGLRRLRDLAEGAGILDVSVEQLQLGAGRVQIREPGADPFELGGVAPRESPARALVGVRGQVLGRQPPGEPGGAKDDDVVSALG